MARNASGDTESSNMAMLTSRTVSRPRPRVLSASSTSALPLRCQTQIRTFRFGIWPTCFDHPYHRELRRRHRNLKRKYIDSFDRKLWDDIEHSLSAQPGVAFKRAMARFWAPTDAKDGSPWPGQDELKSRKAASPSSSYATWRSKIEEIINASPYRTPSDANPRNQSTSGPETRHPGNSTEPSHLQKIIRSEPNFRPGQDYIIDPITNRKVPKKGCDATGVNLEPPTQSFNVDGLHFMSSAPPDSDPGRQPVYSNGKPPTSELNKYAESDFDDWVSPDDSSSTGPIKPSSSANIASRSSENSILKNEYALNHLPLDDPVEDNDYTQKTQAATSNKPVQKTLDGPKRHNASRADPQIDSHPTSSNEPVENSEQLQNELKGYRPYMHNENPRMHHNTQDFSDLEKYRYNASTELEFSTEPSIVYDDLHKYKPTTFEEVEAKDQPFEHEDLHKYKPTTFEEVEAKDQPFEQYGDLEQYKEFRLQHLDPTETPGRDIVTESLKEYEAKEQDDEESNFTDPYDLSLPKKIPKMNLPDEHIFSKHYFGQVAAGAFGDSAGDSLGNIHDGGSMPTGVSAYQQTLDHQGAMGLDQNKVNNNLGSSSSTNTRPDPLSTSVRPINSPRLERALKRHLSALKRDHLNSTFGADLYSKDPQGLETSFSKENGGRHTMPLYRRHYGSEPGQVAPRSNHAADSEPKKTSEDSSDLYYHRDPEIDGIPSSESTELARDQRGTQPDQPTIYKILAYDPTTQTISVAETSSVVPDLASPLSPTEVLPRLSNPSKFFSHFPRLQAEGFEIVSGSGDTLVFRQVRPARGATPGAAPVNPIDLMGRSTAVPNAAAFVSPTGFVNYDMPRVEEEPAEAARRPNVGVRDEAVPIGQTSSSQKQGSKKKKRMNVAGRVIVGGAWVAGISYALGVLGEYFITGGADGKGPTGFSPL